MTRNDDEVSINLARLVADAVAAGDHDEAVRLTRLLAGQLTAAAGHTASRTEAPDFAARPTVVPVAERPASSRSSRQVVAEALAEIGVACRARVVAEYAEARFGQRVEPRSLSALRRDEKRAWEKSSPR